MKSDWAKDARALVLDATEEDATVDQWWFDDCYRDFGEDPVLTSEGKILTHTLSDARWANLTR